MTPIHIVSKDFMYFTNVTSKGTTKVRFTLTTEIGLSIKYEINVCYTF